MRPIFLALALSLTLTGPALAQSEDDTMTVAAADVGETDEVAVDPLEPRNAADVTLEEFLWVARPIIVFADTPADPRVAEQLQLLADRPDALLARDVVIIVDTDPSAETSVRTALRPRGFSLVVLQKDGSVGFRRPAPRDVREISRGIDSFSLRREEIRMGQ
jgi:hypothetical protein